jgi:hypothetical protein
MNLRESKIGELRSQLKMKLFNFDKKLEVNQP